MTIAGGSAFQACHFHAMCFAPASRAPKFPRLHPNRRDRLQWQPFEVLHSNLEVVTDSWQARYTGMSDMPMGHDMSPQNEGSNQQTFLQTTVIHSRKTGMDLRSYTKHQKTETHSHSLNSERVFWPLRMYQLQHAATKGLVYMSETIDGWKWPGEFCTPAVMLPNMIYVQSTCWKE